MKRIKWKELAEKIREKTGEDTSQTRAFSHVVKFFLLMLLLTLIARGTAGATLARVELCRATPQTITHELFATGTVEPRGETAVAVPAGLTVSELLTRPGVAVEKGAGLVAFDPADVSRTLTRKNAQRQQLLVQLEALQDPQTVPDDAVADAQRALERAREDWEQAKAALSDAKDSVETAGQSLRDAEAALSAAPEEEKPAAQADVDAASSRLDAARAALDTASDAETAAEQSVQDGEARLDRAKADYAEAAKQAARTQESNDASAALLRLDIDAMDGEIQALEALNAADCRLYAPADGTVTALPLTVGAMTGGEEQILLATRSQGYELTFQMGKEEAEQVQSSGAKLVVNQEGCEEEVSLYAAAPGEGDMTTFTATLFNPGWTEGQVSVTARLSGADYGTCVPVSAVHRDVDGAFVYVFRTELTILGMQNVAVRVDVNVLDSNGSYTAIAADLPRDAQILSGSSKPLSDGDRVRVNP